MNLPKLEIGYCFPGGDEHLGYAYRFLNTLLQNPPMCEAKLTLLTDAGNQAEALDLFCMVPNVNTMVTPDQGKDLSRYFALAEVSSADVVMFLGGSTYCRRPGWGLRVLTSFQTMGSNNLYGACGHTGVGPVRPHLRTTGFWCSPIVLRRYPKRPKNQAERYMVEHGAGCISDWFHQQGYQRWVINFGTAHTLDRANDDPNGYGGRNKTHSSLLIGDRLCAPPFHPNP